MKQIKTSALEVATRHIGIKEILGIVDNPIIMAMLTLDDDWPKHDEIPWCSAFVNWIAWNLGLSRSGSLMARSWLNVGDGVDKDDSAPGLDIVILSRGSDPKAGHVGFLHEFNGYKVGIVGGNQGNSVSLSYFDTDRILGIRRLVKR